MNPLQKSCVSERSRSGAAQISKLADDPSAEIARVDSLSLWRRANFPRGPRTLCGDSACRIALAVAPCEFSTSPTNPLRRLVLVDCSRCGAANFLRRRRTLCGDCACRIARKGRRKGRRKRKRRRKNKKRESEREKKKGNEKDNGKAKEKENKKVRERERKKIEKCREREGGKGKES